MEPTQWAMGIAERIQQDPDMVKKSMCLATRKSIAMILDYVDEPCCKINSITVDVTYTFPERGDLS